MRIHITLSLHFDKYKCELISYLVTSYLNEILSHHIRGVLLILCLFFLTGRVDFSDVEIDVFFGISDVNGDGTISTDVSSY